MSKNNIINLKIRQASAKMHKWKPQPKATPATPTIYDISTAVFAMIDL